MTLWLTEQYPFVSKYLPLCVWVRPGREAAARDLAKKDLVFIYEVVRNTETGEGPGAKSVIYLVEVTELVHKKEGDFIRVANAKEIAKGNCPRHDLLKILKRKSIQSMGPLNSKLMKLNDKQFDQIATYFPKFKSKIASFEEEAIAAFESSNQKRGQEFASKEVRDIIERYSMDKAKNYFSNNGYHVEDHHTTSPYDLLCRRKKEEYYIEVKGTQSKGNQVLLTANEVRWIDLHPQNMKLFILHSIEVAKKQNKLTASGGEVLVIEPWKLRRENLLPIGYRYDLSDNSNNS